MVLQGLVLKGVGGLYFVSTNDGIFECNARGIFKNNNETLYVGDNVEILVTDEEKSKAVIEKILPRKNLSLRPKVANIDLFVIIATLREPKMNLDFIDRLLVKSELLDCKKVLCFNKADLADESEILNVEEIYKSVGYDVIFTSTYDDKIGVDILKDRLKNKVSILTGNSGVGKSSLINNITSNITMEVGVLSKKNQRGKHTTRHTELFMIDDNTYIIDSPGFQTINFDDVELEQIKDLFPEFREHSKNCYYNNCDHINEPDCGVKNEVNKSIKQIRYDRYLQFYDEVKNDFRRSK